MQASISLHTLLAKRQLGSNASFENFTNSHIKSNMRGKNCLKTTFHSQSKIEAFFTEGNLAATLDRNGTIKLWDLERKVCRWTLPSDNNHTFTLGQIKIVDGNIVYVETKYYSISFGEESQESRSIKHLIHIIDLKTGKEKGRIDDPLLNPRLIHATCENIFCFINDGELIKRWDFSARLIETIPSKQLRGINNSLLASKKYLVHLSENGVIAHDMDTRSYREINFKLTSLEGSSITCTTVYNSHLLCGIYAAKDDGSTIHCCGISLDTGEIVPYGVHQYKSSPKHIYKNIVVYNRMAYLDCSDGTLQSINVSQDETATSILSKTQSTESLSLDKDLLTTFSLKHKLKIWDLNTCEQLNIRFLKRYKNFQLTAGKVLAISGKCMVQWDYLRGATDAGERSAECPIGWKPPDLSADDTVSCSDSDSDAS